MRYGFRVCQLRPMVLRFLREQFNVSRGTFELPNGTCRLTRSTQPVFWRHATPVFVCGSDTLGRGSIAAGSTHSSGLRVDAECKAAYLVLRYARKILASWRRVEKMKLVGILCSIGLYRMQKMRFAAILSAVFLLAAGCAQEAAPVPVSRADIQIPPPPDVGEISRFLDCAAEPRRDLSSRERCEIAAFKARCNALDDCYVSCLSSPAGVFVGGGCGHVCTRGPHPGGPYPAGVDACASEPGASGLKPRVQPDHPSAEERDH